MERAKQLGKIDARCILEPAGNLIDHAGRITDELRGVAIAIHLNGVDSCQRLCDSLGDLRHDIVLDNACGSGSFCVAAVLEGRSFIGIEKNEDVALFKKQPVDYIDICNQRIKEAKRTFEAEQQAIS